MDWLKNILEVGGFKKFLVAMLGAAVLAFNNKIGLGLDEATIAHVVEIVVAFLFAQVFADHSKQAIKALQVSAPVNLAGDGKGKAVDS